MLYRRAVAFSCAKKTRPDDPKRKRRVVKSRPRLRVGLPLCRPRLRVGLLLLGALGLIVLAGSSARAADPPQATLESVRKIWDKAEHNAFTDLVRFQDRWYCVFREGSGHVSADGALRVILSDDGKEWASAALIKSATGDLRDPKICITPDNRLMLTGAEAVRKAGDARHQTFVWFSKDGKSWSERHPIGDADYWLWRITWHKDKAYGVGYGTRGDDERDPVRLLPKRRRQAVRPAQGQTV